MNVMVNHPKVSVIIPAYNAAKFISSTIESVLQQTFTEIELIIINDGSTDDTEHIALKFTELDNRVRVISVENSGVSAARNTGMSAAKGEYLALLDADDLMSPTSIEERLQRFKEDDFGLVHCDLKIIDEHGKPTGEIKSGLEGRVLDDLLAWKRTVIPTPSSVIFKKSVFEQIGGFEVQLSNNADQEFFYRVAAKFNIGRVQKPLGMYRVHQHQMHKNIDLMYRDTLLAYKLATENGLFKSRAFRRKCYARMYFILANCFLKDAKKPFKAVQLYFRSFLVHPTACINNLFIR